MSAQPKQRPRTALESPQMDTTDSPAAGVAWPVQIGFNGQFSNALTGLGAETGPMAGLGTH